ncbi:MAG: hypothetical protein ACJ72E_16800 [Marmoricola sp.]
MRTTVLTLLTALALLVGLTVLDTAEAATPAYKVTLHTSVAKSTAEHFIVVSGTVTGPKAAGHTVTIQRRYVGGPWITVATATISSRGRYKARVETPRGGTTSFRAIKSRSSVRRAGVSAVRSIPVYRWINLAGQNSLDNINDSNLQTGIEETVSGKTAPSVDMYADGDVEYKLSGLCSRLTFTAAYTGTSPASMSVDVVKTPINGGPSTTVPGVVNTGTPLPVQTSLSGFRYVLLETNGYDSGNKLVVWNPQVYCNADQLPAFVLDDLK